MYSGSFSRIAGLVLARVVDLLKINVSGSPGPEPAGLQQKYGQAADSLPAGADRVLRRSSS